MPAPPPKELFAPGTGPPSSWVHNVPPDAPLTMVGGDGEGGGGADGGVAGGGGDGEYCWQQPSQSDGESHMSSA